MRETPEPLLSLGSISPTKAMRAGWYIRASEHIKFPINKNLQSGAKTNMRLENAYKIVIGTMTLFLPRTSAKYPPKSLEIDSVIIETKFIKPTSIMLPPSSRTKSEK